MAEFCTSTLRTRRVLGGYFKGVLSGEENYSSEPESHGQRQRRRSCESEDVVVVVVVDDRSQPFRVTKGDRGPQEARRCVVISGLARSVAVRVNNNERPPFDPPKPKSRSQPDESPQLGLCVCNSNLIYCRGSSSGRWVPRIYFTEFHLHLFINGSDIPASTRSNLIILT